MRGNNFLCTILRLAQERDELRVVADQHGAPTWCRTIADITADIVAQSKSAQYFDIWWHERSAIYNLTAEGRTTWYGFAQAILNHSSITKKPLVIPIATQEYPLSAKRPKYSLMSRERLIKTFCGLPDWERTLKLCQD